MNTSFNLFSLPFLVREPRGGGCARYLLPKEFMLWYIKLIGCVEQTELFI